MENNDTIRDLQNQIITWLFSAPDEDLVLEYVEKLPNKYGSVIPEITDSSLVRLDFELDEFLHSTKIEEFDKLKKSEQFYYLNFIAAYGIEDATAQLKKTIPFELEESKLKSLEVFAKKYIEIWDSIIALSISPMYMRYLLYIPSVASIVDSQDIGINYENSLNSVTLRLSKNIENGQIPNPEEIDEERSILSKLSFLSSIALNDLLEIENLSNRFDLYMSLSDIISILLRAQLASEVPNLTMTKMKIWSLLKQRMQRMVLIDQDIAFYLDHPSLRGVSQWYSYFNRMWVPSNFMKQGFVGEFKAAFDKSGIQDKNSFAELLISFLQSSVVLKSMLEPYDSYAIVNRIVLTAKEGNFENLRSVMSLYPESIKEIIDHLFISIFESLRYFYQK